MFDYRDMFDDLHLMVTTEIIRYFYEGHIHCCICLGSWDITLTEIGLLKHLKK